jgi:hypothetical protein
MILMEEYEKRKDVLRAKFSSTICDMLQDDLESSTFRNRAYFFFMFYLHDISIQSLKLVSYITVELSLNIL